MYKKNVFYRYHPAAGFLFYLGAIVFGMLAVHPVYAALSMLGAASCSLLLGYGAARFCRLLPVFAAVAVLNPLLNTRGETILFSVLGRPYTWEALCCGMTVGGMFVSVLLWFWCWNSAMLGDQLLALFGGSLPDLSLLLVMVLRLIPEYTERAERVSAARRCMGRGGSVKTRREQRREGGAVLSSLSSWVLESSVCTADSMRARGYGSGRRSCFLRACLHKRDYILLAIQACLLGGIALAALCGGMDVRFFPALSFGTEKPLSAWAGIVCYGILVFLPTAMMLWEEALWHVLKSKI